jgi:hypothetical protein
METIKNVFLAIDGVCWALIIGVGIYRFAKWIKADKPAKKAVQYPDGTYVGRVGPRFGNICPSCGR